MLNEKIMREYKRWLSSEAVDSESREELACIKDDEDEIEIRFIDYLQFGTAGLRGKMKAGINMMNVYTVRHATQGLASFIISENKADRGMVIAYDSRNNSREFAAEAACVMAANGINPVYIFDDIRPTPVLSYAVRELKCISGINITASHNPKEYNGYKAYWEDGAQLSLEQADRVSEYISKTDIFGDVKSCDYDQAVKDGKIIIIGQDFDEKYMAEVMNQSVYKNIVREVSDDLKIVYTPLHGTGNRIIPEVLKRTGLKYLYTVDEQMAADGNFPTVEFPNPEYKEVFGLGIKLAGEVESDLIIATDPDADRTGIVVRAKDGGFITFTGNQVGALLLDYIITALREQDKMPDEPYAVKTIVSTEIVSKICEANNVTLHNVLTGFKFIGEVIKEYEASGKGEYLFGFEESYGYLKGTYARDKDAVVASMLICEMAAYYKKKGMTLYDALLAMYERYGKYVEGAENLYYEGIDGLEIMNKIMERMRNNPPKELAGEEVIFIRDYLSGTILNVKTGGILPTNLPSSNVLYYQTAEGNVTVIRPSGTEPKIKIYYLLHEPADVEEFKKDIEKLRAI